MGSAVEKDACCCGGHQFLYAPLKSARFLFSDGKLRNIYFYSQRKNIHHLLPDAAVFPEMVVLCSYLTLELEGIEMGELVKFSLAIRRFDTAGMIQRQDERS